MCGTGHRLWQIKAGLQPRNLHGDPEGFSGSPRTSEPPDALADQELQDRPGLERLGPPVMFVGL